MAKGCTGLPQPRSRMAFAAATRANAFAVSLSMIAESTLIALSVLLLAKSRMSKIVGALNLSVPDSCATG